MGRKKDGGRIRKTISFKKPIFEKLEETRGEKKLSQKVNDDYAEKFELDKNK